MSVIRRSGVLVGVVALATSTLVLSTFSAGASAADRALPWPSLVREKRAAAIADAKQVPAAAPNLATAPTPKIVFRDPVGDVAPPESDVTAVGYGHNANGFVFSINVAHAVNPKTDPGWQEGFSFAGWALDLTGDGVPERLVIMSGDGAGHVFADMLSIDSDADCAGTAIYKPGVGYQVLFSPHCGSTIHHFRMQAAMSYTTDPDDEDPPFDTAPDNGFSGNLTLSDSRAGYWLLRGDGQTHAFGLARHFTGGVYGAAAIAAKRNGSGYWIVDFLGGAHPFGSATNRGGYPLLAPGERITTAAATPSGEGYWMFSNRGRVFVYGDAHSYGDMSGAHLNRPIVAAIGTPSGHGYYLLGADGGVFTFGDAIFRGSTGGRHLNQPVVDIVSASSGYWLVAADGGVFAFHAPFRGSMGGTRLNSPVTAGVVIGNGYLLIGADGGVFNFSNQPFSGSLGATPPASPVIDAAAFTR